MAYAFVRELVRARGISMTCRNAYVLLNVLINVKLWQCVCTYVWSSPCRRISLLGISQQVVGKIYFRC